MTCKAVKEWGLVIIGLTLISTTEIFSIIKPSKINFQSNLACLNKNNKFKTKFDQDFGSHCLQVTEPRSKTITMKGFIPRIRNLIRVRVN